ncbi:MAG: hypothetical protein A2580_09445 [Hydrogenophilales bacterium RIFOXYD1_FULL_62_11]|nr:MAG: hypothetical protein A2580_09445 [Hydrogenophilales bacterium RIFOXYD1_FULL_62_11]
MNSDHEDRELGIEADAPAPADAENENRLQLKRELLRQRLAEEKKNDGIGDIDGIARMAAPLARQFVRQHPYASLSGAALAGVWLVRRKPWRALGGSLLAGLLARQALTLALSSGNQLLKGLTAAARSRQASNRMP